jgi:transcriptional regulator with XRE-family HTH domain
MSMSQPPSPSQQRLISILRGLREGAGLTTYQLADVLGWSQSRVTRVENGIIQASADDADAWAEATGADAGTREDLAALAYSAWNEVRSWRVSHRGGLAARQREVSQLEHRATAIRQFQPEAIPGLLQSESYAAYALAFADVTEKGGIEKGAKARIGRQAILREPGRTFDFVLGEGALRWRPGPRALMEGQLGHLLAAAALPSVSLSVIPYDREAVTGYQHAFTIYRIPDGDTVMVELFHGENFPSAPAQIELYERLFAMLKDSALHGDEALAFARSVILG